MLGLSRALTFASPDGLGVHFLGPEHAGTLFVLRPGTGVRPFSRVVFVKHAGKLIVLGPGMNVLPSWLGRCRGILIRFPFFIISVASVSLLNTASWDSIVFDVPHGVI